MEIKLNEVWHYENLKETGPYYTCDVYYEGKIIFSVANKDEVENINIDKAMLKGFYCGLGDGSNCKVEVAIFDERA